MELSHRWMTREERRKYHREQAKDPMGIIASTVHLLVPDYMNIANDVSKHVDFEGLEIQSTEANEMPGSTLVSSRLNPELKMSIMNDIRACLLDTEDVKRYLGELDSMVQTISKNPKNLRIKRRKGRPIKSFVMPETALTNMIFHWAINVQIWPLPRYFYAQFNRTASSRYVRIEPELFDFFRMHCEDVPEKNIWIEKPNDKKLYRKELPRDAWLFLTYCYLKEEDRNATYYDLAELLVSASTSEGVFADYDEDSDEILDESEKMREKNKKSMHAL